MNDSSSSFGNAEIVVFAQAEFVADSIILENATGFHHFNDSFSFAEIVVFDYNFSPIYIAPESIIFGNMFSRAEHSLLSFESLLFDAGRRPAVHRETRGLGTVTWSVTLCAALVSSKLKTPWRRVANNSTPGFTTCVFWLALYRNATLLREHYGFYGNDYEIVERNRTLRDRLRVIVSTRRTDFNPFSEEIKASGGLGWSTWQIYARFYTFSMKLASVRDPTILSRRGAGTRGVTYTGEIGAAGVRQLPTETQKKESESGY
ncbi:hypothetical protein DFH07DRAFT_778898 [Mycena maculata]|uniref:Uncharacterized protein n=1 Tax=Mycena maculata TaxID=230809 RepID=A0AAD7IAS3_9AGAR|nr:hypothetical protein DFH07DRAFT_778898 [Mycena maculata]